MKPPIVVADEEDLPVLLPMVKAFHEEAHIPYHEIATAEAVRSLVNSRFLGIVYLIISGEKDEPVGYVALTQFFSIEFGGTCFFIDELYLKPSARGRGLAASVFEAIMDVPPDREMKAFLLEVNPDNIAAQNLYRRLGFKPRPYNLEYLVVKGLEERD